MLRHCRPRFATSTGGKEASNLEVQILLTNCCWPALEPLSVPRSPQSTLWLDDPTPDTKNVGLTIFTLKGRVRFNAHRILMGNNEYSQGF